MSDFVGTGALLRLAWRRDRVVIPISVLAVAAGAVSTAQASLALYPTPQSLGADVTAVLTNPAALALYGPITDPTKPDSFAIYKMGMMGAVFLTLITYGLVRRHTRTEEEQGRLELLGATVVGRFAPLTAALVVATGTALATCLVTLVGYLGLGMDPLGSLASVIGWAAAALAFVGITAVAAQLAGTARGCAGLAVGTLGVSYIVRAVADGSSSAPHWLVWLSPLGWSEQVSAFGQNRLWVGLLGLATGLLGTAVAFLLLQRRDLGAGLLATRPGPAHAARGLSSSIGLAWRLARPGLIGWSVGFLALGAVVGNLAQSVTDMLNDPGIRDMLAKLGGGSGTLVDVYLSTELNIAAFVAAAYGITVVLRLRAEEAEGHAEQVLATRATRHRWLAGHLTVALLGSGWLMLLGGATIAATDTSQSSLTGGFGTLLAAALVRLPAIWVMVGIGVAAFALARNAVAGISWGLLGVFLFVGEFGALLSLPAWVENLAPFSHSPHMPLESFRLLPVVVLLAAAVALVGVGAAVFRRRDIG